MLAASSASPPPLGVMTCNSARHAAVAGSLVTALSCHFKQRSVRRTPTSTMPPRVVTFQCPSLPNARTVPPATSPSRCTQTRCPTATSSRLNHFGCIRLMRLQSCLASVCPSSCGGDAPTSFLLFCKRYVHILRHLRKKMSRERHDPRVRAVRRAAALRQDQEYDPRTACRGVGPEGDRSVQREMHFAPHSDQPETEVCRVLDLQQSTVDGRRMCA